MNRSNRWDPGARPRVGRAHRACFLRAAPATPRLDYAAGASGPRDSSCFLPEGALQVDFKRQEELPEERRLPQLETRLQHGAVHVRRPDGGPDPGTRGATLGPRHSGLRQENAQHTPPGVFHVHP